ncbi:MAG: hypothetical protein F6J97_17825 [Leptolyngbya sp. SIO4C1]|nr:hypothetical protein [Leptolyngbya sp. SIO4C1]
MIDIQPSQILYLEHSDARLYTEVIQTVRHCRLWARPLMLVQGLPPDPYQRQQAIEAAAADVASCALTLYDLKAAPDLVWPVSAFHTAFDTDFFSLLFHLKLSDSVGDAQTVRQHFDRFLQGCCQIYDSADSARYPTVFS